MQRYDIWVHYDELQENQDSEGSWVRHDDAQEEILRLQAQLAEANAEVERLRKLTLKLGMERHVPAMRVAHEMHKQQEQATDDYMALVEKCDTAWNDAIEAAANLSEKSSTEGGVAMSMAFFAKPEDYWVYKQACLVYARAILKLKRS